ncbi:unnamed protein product [Allacma fusca]|uniref:Uncharacterized protein n=1 Tax=Allacma fusca TaxID=39272 RepID=A0A8J2NZD4_9HEXA|nr:unnamed protein product [Allacma fusca]
MDYQGPKFPTGFLNVAGLLMGNSEISEQFKAHLHIYGGSNEFQKREEVFRQWTGVRYINNNANRQYF